MRIAAHKSATVQANTDEPLRKLEQVRAIRNILAEKPRDLLLFTLGTSNALRVWDLLKLTVGEVRKVKAGDSISIAESKSGRKTVLVMNRRSHEALRNYPEWAKPDDDDHLFKSKKGNEPLTVPSVKRLVRQWAGAAKVQGRFGAQSLRKTWGYIQHVEFGVPVEVISRRFLHGSPDETAAYLGL